MAIFFLPSSLLNKGAIIIAYLLFLADNFCRPSLDIVKMKMNEHSLLYSLRFLLTNDIVSFY